MRTDLADVHIAVCAPEVLLAFSDNFDYQHVRRDFVPGVLSEEELGHKLYVHEAPRGAYAARVHNLRSYDAVSRDVLGRWAFPFAPDTNLLGAGSAYAFARGGRYLEAGVSVPRTAVVGPQCAIGAHTEIGEGARIEASVVGRGCTVGRGAELLGCYLMDGAVVQEGARLRCVSLGCVAWGARGRGHCMFALSAGCRLPQRAIADSIPSPPPHPARRSYALVCEGATVRAGAVVGPGAIISYGVVVGPRHTVPPHARLSLCRQLRADASASSEDELEYARGGSGACRGACLLSCLLSGWGVGGVPRRRRPPPDPRRHARSLRRPRSAYLPRDALLPLLLCPPPPRSRAPPSS